MANIRKARKTKRVVPPPPDAPEAQPVDFEVLEKMLGPDVAEDVQNEARRADMMERVARYRWVIAQKFHQLEDGNRLDFDKYRFQRQIYQDPAQYQVVSGSVQWGKTEFLICSAIAFALCGMGVFYVIDKYEKRDKIVQSRLGPTLESVPIYQQLMKAAKDRGADVDSARFKHIGQGFINFVGSNSPGDFSSYKADVGIVDEHQLCVPENLGKLSFRMMGSDWRFRILVGNPRGRGTQENRNLDYEYSSGTQYEWYIPCDFCNEWQVLGWEKNFVWTEKNPASAIIRWGWQDEDWSPESFPLDLKPLCGYCRRPVNRLHREGRWIAKNPDHPKHTYKLSNLYNPKPRMQELYDMWSAAVSDPNAMRDFVNDQLGEPYDLDGTQITREMLDAAATCKATGIQTYKFMPTSQMRWNHVAA